MRVSRSLVALGVVGLAVAAAQACSAGSEDRDSGSESVSSGTNSGSGGALGLGGNGTGGINPAGTGGGENCAATEAEATEGVAPADIIIAVDTSGSMDEEAVYTQNAMPSMVAAIVGSGVDAHLVMISSNDICVPGPVGSGSCPADENLPTYRHVQQGVGSNDALQKILDTYPQWQPSLRPTATKTIVVVSDDDSNLGANAFSQQLVALDATFQGFKFHAIVAPSFNVGDAGNCSFTSNCGSITCCGPNSDPFPFCMYLSAAEGTVYKTLVQQTAGVLGDLCTQQFQPVFQAMATAVIQGSQIPCVYDIPPPMGNDEIDYTKVNVAYAPDPNTPPTDIFNVPGGAADCDASGGWYYDNPANPTQILLCDATCNVVQASSTGKVTVKFGCATKIK